MILPDVNLLIYAHDQESPHHAGAVSWWEGCLNGGEQVGLLPVVALGFVRIVAHPSALNDG